MSPPSSSSPSSSSLSFTSVIQYAAFAVVAYVLAGAPLLSIFSGTSNKPANERYSVDKIESLMIPNPDLVCQEHGYKVHIFNRDPLVIYVEGFLTEEESKHIVKIRFVT